MDEAHINDTDLSKGYGQTFKFSLSRQQLCICVAIDVHKNPVKVVCAHGKQGSAHEECHGRQDRARIAAHPRPRVAPRRVGQGRRAREDGAPGRRKRPSLPGADGECKRPVLLAQAQAVAIHGGVATEPLVVFRLGAYPFQVNRTKDRRARP